MVEIHAGVDYRYQRGHAAPVRPSVGSLDVLERGLIDVLGGGGSAIDERLDDLVGLRRLELLVLLHALHAWVVRQLLERAPSGIPWRHAELVPADRIEAMLDLHAAARGDVLDPGRAVRGHEHRRRLSTTGQPALRKTPCHGRSS